MVSRHALAKISSTSPTQLMAAGPCSRPVEEVARLERILAPASREERLKTVEKLMNQFQVTAPARKEDREAQIHGYLLAMEGYPFWAIIDAGTAFVRGAVAGHNPAFMPKPAEIGREVASRADVWRGKLGLARRRVAEEEALGPEVREPTSESVRQHAARRIAELRASVDADRHQRFGRAHTDWVDPNPITPEAMAAAGVPDAAARASWPGAGSSFRPLRRDAEPLLADLQRRRAAAEIDALTETAARGRSSTGGGQTGALVESDPTPERYRKGAISSSSAGDTAP